MTLEQRAKEIGIRKILGAGKNSITILLGKEFFFLALVSISIATPFAWHLGNVWLGQFAYKIDLGWNIYFTSMLIVFLVTISGICVSLIKGNNVNPADMLKAD